MIPRDVRMEVLPDALDSVRVGAVGRQKVEDDRSPKVAQRLARHPSGVHRVVVDNEVDPPSAWMRCPEEDEQLTEEGRSLLGGARREERTGDDVESACQVVLLVLAGCDDPTLVPAQHPLPADLGVEVNVHLISVENRLAFGRAVLERANLPE